MNKTCKVLLLAELFIAFTPICLAWMVFVVLTLDYLPDIGASDFHWESLLLMVGLCVAGAIGAIALDSMRIYLFWGGKRSIPKRRMIVYCAVAIVVLAALTGHLLVLRGEPDYFGVVFLAPLLSALHVLWLGRSYFTG